LHDTGHILSQAFPSETEEDGRRGIACVMRMTTPPRTTMTSLKSKKKMDVQEASQIPVGLYYL
jgi:hypothetical protein